jgi:RNA polymerase sigma-70 factor (ECF subfamily)
VGSALIAYARRRLPKDEADDAVSETFLRAVRRIDDFRWRGAGFDAWLYGILRNVVYEMIRRRRPDDGDRLGAVAGAEDDPLEHAVHLDEAAMLRAAFVRLGPDDQELLELRVVAGLDTSQMAKVLGKRPGAVRMAQSRALARLREAFVAVGGT